MATGKIDAQEIGNGSGPVTLTKQSAAKAMINANQATGGTIRSSLNISSTTDNSEGKLTVGYTNAFSSADHFPVTSGVFVYPSSCYDQSHAENVTTTGYIYSSGVWTSNATQRDFEYVICASFGDLAT